MNSNEITAEEIIKKTNFRYEQPIINTDDTAKWTEEKSDPETVGKVLEIMLSAYTGGTK